MRVRDLFWLALVLGAIPAHADRGLDLQLFDAAREGNAGRVGALLREMASAGGHEDAAKLLQERAAAADRSRRQDQ